MILYFQRSTFHKDVFNAAYELRVRVKAGQPFGLRMAADEQAVIGVGGRDARNPDSGLSENLIYW